MKKLTAIFLTILILITALTACQGEKQALPTPPVNSDNSSISNNTDTPIDETTKQRLLAQADILSEHIIKYGIYSYNILDHNTSKIKNNLNITNFSNEEIFRFIASIFIYKESENHPYTFAVEYIEKINHEYISYSLENVKPIVSEFFGIEDWFLETYEYDQEKNSFIIPTEAGYGNNLLINEISSVCNTDNIIETTMSLSPGNIGENSLISYGKVTIRYSIIKSGNEYFLRFKEIIT